MNKKLLDILACPIDKHFPLELIEIKTQNDIVTVGALFCQKCSRFYPVIEEIPIMLPDDLRDKKQDLQFLKENKANLPEKIIKQAAPWHL